MAAPRVYDNIFVERLWRTVKYEEVYLHEYQSMSEARQSLETKLIFILSTKQLLNLPVCAHILTPSIRHHQSHQPDKYFPFLNNNIRT